MKLNIRNKAFTLAEVLLTLVIIGVIAAITIPSLVQTTGKKELEVAFKKQYSVLKQAVLQIKSEDYLDFNNNSYGSRFKKVLAAKYIELRDCGSINHSTGCVLLEDDNTFSYYKTLTGNSLNRSLFDDGGFISNDGTTFFVEQGSQSIYTGYIVSIDVNGYKKGPNRMGKDFFMFQITEDGDVLPMGAENTYFYSSKNTLCSKTSSNSQNGFTCAFFAATDKEYFRKL